MSSWHFAPLALLFLLPGAAAQPPSDAQGTLTVRDPEYRIVPELEPFTTLVVLEWSCSDEELAAGPSTVLRVEFEPVPAMEHAVATLSPASTTITAANAQQCVPSFRHRVESTLTLVVTRRALAFEKHTIELAARVTQTTNTGSTNQWGPFRANLTYEADYLPAFEATADPHSAMMKQPDEWQRFRIQVESGANGPSRLAAKLIVPEEAQARLLPGDELLFEDPASLEDAPREWTLEAMIPGSQFREGLHTPLRVGFEMESLDPRGTRREESQMEFVLLTPYEDRLVPGFEAVGLALALGAAMLAMVRRRLT